MRVKFQGIIYFCIAMKDKDHFLLATNKDDKEGFAVLDEQGNIWRFMEVIGTEKDWDFLN